MRAAGGDAYLAKLCPSELTEIGPAPQGAHSDLTETCTRDPSRAAADTQPVACRMGRGELREARASPHAGPPAQRRGFATHPLRDTDASVVKSASNGALLLLYDNSALRIDEHVITVSVLA